MADIGDFHCDTPSRIYFDKLELENNKSDWSLSKTKDEFLQVFAVCIEDEVCKNPFLRCKDILENFKRQLNKYSIPVVYNKFYYGKTNAILAIEGGKPFQGDIGNIKRFYDMGVRVITLTWNYENELGYGALTGSMNGLKEFGKDVIKEMNRLKIVPDLSHLNEQGFWDALFLSEIPPVASHSNSKKICNNPRNLTDEQFLAIAEKGGVVGINSYPLFLNNTPKAEIKDIIKHIEHFMSLGKEDNICLGCDFDGIDCKTKDFYDISCYENLVNELAKINYSEEKIAKIIKNNIKNYLKSQIFEFF